MTVFNWISYGIKKSKYQLTNSKNEPATIENLDKDSIHKTPPGQYPKNGPSPSKVAVVLFYISVIFTMIGSIFAVRTIFIIKVSRVH